MSAVNVATLRHPPPVRRRLLPAAVGLALFISISRTLDHPYTDQTWLVVGVGLTLSATFVEPFFTRPQDGIVNAGGAIAAALSFDRSELDALWATALIFLSVVLGLSLVSVLMGNDASRLKWVAAHVAAVFGRAVVVGPALLILVVLTEATKGAAHTEWAAAAIGAITAGLAVNWSALITRVTGQQTDFGIALAAIGPRMLLSTGGVTALTEGQRVRVSAGGRTAEGNVVLRLPHRDGLRYQIALEEDAFSVTPSFPADIAIEACATTEAVIGVAGAGSTEMTVAFEPFSALEIGEPVALTTPFGPLLYQTSALRLVRNEWAGAASIAAHAVATQIGWPEGGHLKSQPHLPTPHARITKPAVVAADLPADFFRIGVAKGTAIPIGIRLTGDSSEHLAVLGMSGTGKTAAAHRIARHLGQTRLVIALDETGEYRTRLGVPAWSDGDFGSVGLWVHEPTGDPPVRAKEFVERCMSAANNEYVQGIAPNRRVVLLEEAHGFIPEWQVALRHQQEAVAYTTRLIMQARKFGITFIIVSQRTAVVSKSALSQCENYVILRSIDETSLGYLETLVGPVMRDAIGGLGRYEAVCVGPSFNTERPVVVSLDAP